MKAPYFYLLYVELNGQTISWSTIATSFWRLYIDFPKNDFRISPNLKGTVYCTAIRVGGQKEWDFAWQRYINSNVGSEKDILLGALGCSRETWILARLIFIN